MNARSIRVHPRAGPRPSSSSAPATVPAATIVPMTDEGRLRALLQYTPVGIIVVDADGVVRLANPAYLTMTGQRPEIVGTRVAASGPWGRSGLLAGLKEAFDSGRTVLRHHLPLVPPLLPERLVLDIERSPLAPSGLGVA